MLIIKALAISPKHQLGFAFITTSLDDKLAAGHSDCGHPAHEELDTVRRDMQFENFQRPIINAGASRHDDSPIHVAQEIESAVTFGFFGRIGATVQNYEIACGAIQNHPSVGKNCSSCTVIETVNASFPLRRPRSIREIDDHRHSVR